MFLKFVMGVLALTLGCASGLRAEAEPRIALVIGNAHYAGQYLPELANPINDARLVAAALKQVGFQVLVVNDANQMQMKRALVDFGETVAAAGPTATAAFYYAGHGVQIGGKNYLIPIGAQIAREVDVSIEAITVGEVIIQLAFAGPKVSILMLDAGRKNGLSRGFRSGSSDLDELSQQPGLFTSYSTARGESAADGPGPNGPYVVALSKAMQIPGLTIDEVFRQVRAEVAAKADGRTTVDTSTLTAPFYFLRKD